MENKAMQPLDLAHESIFSTTRTSLQKMGASTWSTYMVFSGVLDPTWCSLAKILMVRFHFFETRKSLPLGLSEPLQFVELLISALSEHPPNASAVLVMKGKGRAAWKSPAAVGRISWPLSFLELLHNQRFVLRTGCRSKCLNVLFARSGNERQHENQQNQLSWKIWVKVTYHEANLVGLNSLKRRLTLPKDLL